MVQLTRPSVIQIRGTSGSGKSTVVRAVMNEFHGWTPVMRSGRKQPLYYESEEVVVLGHYESPCGGCDTIGSAKAVYDLIGEVEARTILCEGLLLSEDVKWSSQLKGLRVIFLTTPLETCLRRIRGRRKTAGNTKPLNPNNTANRVATIERARVKLTNLGVPCRQCSADEAPRIILGWLGLAAVNSGV